MLCTQFILRIKLFSVICLELDLLLCVLLLTCDRCDVLTVVEVADKIGRADLYRILVFC